jgi:anti-sigma regulatory factor (Ser/Thr protein kinase)
VELASPRRLHVNRSLRLRLPARPERIEAVRRALDDLGLPSGMLEDAKLLASELISNSILHAGLGPDDTIEVTIVWSGDAVRVTVRDAGTTPLPDHVVVGSIRPSPTGQSGWGLYLVDRLATRWGTNVGGRDGFWFELERSPASDR